MRQFLFSAVNPVVSECGRTSCGDPHTSQGVVVDFVVLYKSYAFLVHIDSSVKSAVYSVAANNRITLGSDLDSGQCIEIGRAHV